jgi:hypothetical protein
MRKRAEVAYGSLDMAERRPVDRALDALLSTSLQELIQSGKIRKFKASSGFDLYIYRCGPRLRLVLSRNRTLWMVEDIVDHDRLLRILTKAGGEDR